VIKPWTLRLSAAILIVALISGCGTGGSTATLATEPATPAGTQATATPPPTEPSPTGVSAVTPAELPTATTGTTAVPAADPFDLLSLESLFGFLEDLTAIQPYSGWRNSATVGEAQAQDYVAATLGDFSFLQDLGVELESQSFHVYLATELWETRLELTLDGQEVEVPADGARGPRDDATQAQRFDSDGELNDTRRDPVIAAGEVVIVRTAAEIERLTREQLQDKIVFLDYAVVDRSLIHADVAVPRAWTLLDKRPAGLVLVTQFSNALGESHGPSSTSG
jgi:hypothetical protein